MTPGLLNLIQNREDSTESSSECEYASSYKHKKRKAILLPTFLTSPANLCFRVSCTCKHNIYHTKLSDFGNCFLKESFSLPPVRLGIHSLKWFTGGKGAGWRCRAIIFCCQQDCANKQVSSQKNNPAAYSAQETFPRDTQCQTR